MKFRQEELDYLFKNIKNGDFLAFYNTVWYYIGSKAIAFLTGNKLDHEAGVFNVRRLENRVYFDLGEQKTSAGKITNTYIIIQKEDGTYLTDSRFRKKTLTTYHLPNIHTLTEEQNAKLHKYWNTPEPYSILSLPLTLNWIYKLVNLVRKNKLTTLDRFCSGACKKSMDIIGIYPSKSSDNAPSPAEFAMFSYIKEIVKINMETKKPKEDKVKKKKKGFFKWSHIGITAVIIGISYLLYDFYIPHDFCEYDKGVVDNIIEASEQCKEGYYVSWIQFNKDFASRYQFADVIGYNQGTQKVYSVKYSGANALYGKQDLRISKNLHEYLLNVGGLKGAFIDRYEISKIINEHNELKDIWKDINHELESIAFAVTHEESILSKGQLIPRIKDVFLISKEKGIENNACNRQQMITIVERLASLKHKIDNKK